MHHDLALIINIAVALLTAFIGGYLARRVGLPTMVGYLLAGLVLGPFTPGFVGDIGDISQLAEMGVIFMLFGVGLHFSLKDLWAVRNVAIPGALLQTLISTGLGFGLTQLWGWSINAGLIVGLAISIASTVVLLRGLADNGLLNTAQGQVAVGWLVFEDLATIAILVLIPALLGNSSSSPWTNAGLALVKTAVFVVLMLFVGIRLLPWILMRIAHTRSRELFILAVVATSLGTALGAAELFGVSLALGAFLAGVVIGESDLSHQVGAEVLPFREIFTVIFFVSVGMLVDPRALIANAGHVLALTTLIVIGKGVLTLLLGLVLPASGRTMLVVSAGLSQIGEFSFIVGQTGVSLGILTQEQYGLILASALISIIINPLLFKNVSLMERLLQRLPALWQRINRSNGEIELQPQDIADHVVLVGYGQVGAHIVDVLQQLKVPLLIVENDASRAIELKQRGVATLFGDAANSEVLVHAHLDHARALVVTVPEEASTELVVAAARDLAPQLPIIARAATTQGVQRLADLGAQDVIHPELEGGLEIVRYTLRTLGYPLLQVQEYIDYVRQDAYETSRLDEQEQIMLHQLLATTPGMEIAWYTVATDSSLVGQSLVEANLRMHTGASAVAIVRDHQVIANPKSSTVFAAGDLVGLIGDAEQVAAAERIIDPHMQTNQAVKLKPGVRKPALA